MEESLVLARLAGSHTLREPTRARPQLAAWRRANDEVASFVRAEAPITFARIRALHAAIVGADAPVPLRAKSTYVGRFPCPEPEDIAPLLAPMLDAFAERCAVHPIAGIALLEQWLVTVHPFDDANGRTSRLVSDWALASHGYPPASYPTLLASAKALVDHGEAPPSPAEGCFSLIAGIAHTLDLVGT